MDETEATTSAVEVLAKIWDDLADTQAAQSSHRAGFYMANAAVIRQLAKERDEALAKIEHLLGVLRQVQQNIIPFTRDTGHNAVDREMNEAIEAVRSALKQ